MKRVEGIADGANTELSIQRLRSVGNIKALLSLNQPAPLLLFKVAQIGRESSFRTENENVASPRFALEKTPVVSSASSIGNNRQRARLVDQ